MNTQDGAHAILQHIEATYVPTHEYVSVSESDYRHLDMRFYRRARLYLEGQGFAHLDDCEDRTITKAPGGGLKPVMIRVMLSSDGTIMSGIYHPRVSRLWLRILLFILRKRLGKIVDFETEFVDGSFVCTSNAMAASAMALPSFVDGEYVSRTTPIERILARHRERVTSKRAKCGIEVRRASGIESVRAAQNRMNAIKAAFRGEIGGVTKEELLKLSPGNSGLASEVHEEIKKLQGGKKG